MIGMEDTDAWMSIAEAATLLRVTERHAWRYTAGAQPRIRKQRQGRRVLLARPDVEALARELERARSPRPRTEPKPEPAPPPPSPLLPASQVDPLTIGDLISLQRAADYAGLTKETLRNYVSRGRLRAKKLGYQWVTTRAAVDEYLESRRRED